MHHCIRLAQLLSFATFVYGGAAYAQGEPMAPSAAETPVTAPAGDDASATTVTGEPAGTSAEGTPAVAAPASKRAVLTHYGVAARWRWVTIPGWFLGLFAEKNVPLSTFNAWGLEGFWRKHDKEDPNRTVEIVVSVGYQNMTPPDGYWLGRGKDPAKDADLVQVRSLGLITVDAAYVVRQYFNPYFGIHYGAGLGLGVVRGKVLRTSATYDQASGQYSVWSNGTRLCDADAKCDEKGLALTEGTEDQGATDPHRFEETSVPGALPILNVLFGLDFPIPDAKGLEFRLEGGFYDAFFIGLSGGYAF